MSDELGARLAECVRRAGGPEGLADASGIPRRTLDTYLKGEAELKVDRLVAIARAAGVRVGWLAEGEPPMLVGGSEVNPGSGAQQDAARSYAPLPRPTRRDTDQAAIATEVVWVPLYEQVEVSAGSGAIVWDELPVSGLAFRRDWLVADIQAKPEDLVLLRVRGESMEPVLHGGDVVMVDRSRRAVERDGLYVFRLDGAVLLKWLQPLPAGAIRVASENRDRYPPFEVSAAQAAADGFSVVGMVRWWAHRAA